MQDYLTMIDLWHYVKDPDFQTLPTDKNEISTFKRNYAKAITAMRNCLSFNGKVLIKNETQANEAWTLIKNENKPKGSSIFNSLFYKRDHLTLSTGKSHTDYVNPYQQLLCKIQEMLSAIKIDINESIYKFHAGLGKDYASYISRYTQTHNAFDKDNDAAYTLDYAIRRFLNICVDPNSSQREAPLSLHALVSTKPSKPPAVKCTYCGKYRHKEDKCWFKHLYLKPDHLKKAPQPQKRKRDESVEVEENLKTSYMAVDEARYYIAFQDVEDPGNFSYVAKSTSLLHTPATRKDFALDTAYSYHSFHNQSVFTSYQDLLSPQEIKGYAGSLQAKGIGNVLLQCISQGRKVEIGFKDVFYVPHAPMNLIFFGQLHGLCSIQLVSQGFSLCSSGIIAHKRQNNLYTLSI